MAKHKDRVDRRLPAGVLRADRATNGPVRKGQPWCYRVQLMVRGQRIARRFDSATPLAEITDGIRSESGTVKADVEQVPVKGAFEADVENDYLPQVSHLASFKERAIDIRRWAMLFKGRNRNRITPVEIRKHLSAWAAGKDTTRKNRHGQTVGSRRLSYSSLNHRLSALSNF